MRTYLQIIRNPLLLVAATLLRIDFACFGLGFHIILIRTQFEHCLIATAVVAPLPGPMMMMVVDMDMHMSLLYIDLISPMGVVMVLNALKIEPVRVVVVDSWLVTIHCRSGISG